MHGVASSRYDPVRVWYALVSLPVFLFASHVTSLTLSSVRASHSACRPSSLAGTRRNTHVLAQRGHGTSL